jgi:hypothetical protein
MKSKKGIAPLVATLVLIILAAGLGVVVLNFGRAQIEIAAQCAVNIGMDFVVLNEKPQACFDRAKSQVFFIVENGPQIPVEGLLLRVIGQNEVLTQEVPDSEIEKVGTILKYIPYNANEFGDVRQIRLTPKITLYDQEITCTEQSVEMENVGDCEN